MDTRHVGASWSDNLIGEKLAATKHHLLCVYTIYIYIYIHPQTDSSIVSQLISVARHTRCLKLRLKPSQPYVILIT